MRALLDLIRENEAAVKDFSAQCRALLGYARMHLKILDPGHGEVDLIKSVAAERAKLSLHLRKPSTLKIEL